MRAPSQIIHDYTLVRLLGSGNFGEVWEGQTSNEHPVALKFIDRARSAAAAEIELKALEKVKKLKHKNLLDIYQSYTDEDPIVIVMELAHGTLSDRLLFCQKEPGQKGIPAEELLYYMGEVASALDYLHGNQLIHRDVKPGNIMLFQSSPPYVKLGDCGLVREIVHEDMQVTTLGTPAFMPPEVWKRRACPRGDQYSLAITYVQLRLGELPFKGANCAELSQKHQYDEPDLSGLDADEPAVERALHKEAGKRFGSCREFVEALRDALNVRHDAFERSGKPVRLAVKPQSIPPPPRGPAPAPQRPSTPQPSDGTIQPSEENTGVPPPRISPIGTLPLPPDLPRPAVVVPTEPSPAPGRVTVQHWLAGGLVCLILLAGVTIFGRGLFPVKPPVKPPIDRLTVKPPGPAWAEAGGSGNLVPLEVLNREGVAGDVALAFDPALPGLRLKVERADKDRIEVRVEADADAPPGFRRATIKARSPEGKGEAPLLTTEEGEVRLDVHVFPRGFQPDGKAVLTGTGEWCFPRLRWQTHKDVVFLLVRRRPGTAEDPPAFYVMENKVTNGQFLRFADQWKEQMANSLWHKGGRAGDRDTGSKCLLHPALRMTWQEARDFASKMGGDLPTPKQLDRAAGWPGSQGEGPFTGEKVAIGRRAEGPSEVDGPHDKDDVSPEGVRGLAGNGREWTREVRTTVGGQRLAVTRGQSYTAPKALRYSDLEQARRGGKHWMPRDPDAASPFVGFRVVLEFALPQ